MLVPNIEMLGQATENLGKNTQRHRANKTLADYYPPTSNRTRKP